MWCLLGVSGRTATAFVAPKRFGVQSDRFGGSEVPNHHRSVGLALGSLATKQ